MDNAALLARRKKVLAPSYYHMFQDPIQIVRGEGAWLWDETGRRFLDCYNNVPSVGHCHPGVVSALSAQAGTLNTHTRYLHETIVTLAERLLAKLPNEIETAVFVCTGSEANDLAIQMARRFTGAQGVAVYDHAYHGNTALTLAASPSEYPVADRPDWLCVLEAPNLYRGSITNQDANAGQRYLEGAIRELDKLDARGQRLSCLLLDTSWDSNGPLLAPPDYVQGLCREVRARGGLIICDEVQAGYCRMGKHWWGFESYGIVPDIVTCGKPMGAGHPIAGVFLPRDIAKSMADRSLYFNTFGGNPVSAAVANAVLDVIENEGLLENVDRTGAYFLECLRSLQNRHSIVGAVQGKGFFYGIDLVTNRDSKSPLNRNDMARLGSMIVDEGVITGTSGSMGQILKLRPPLVFGITEVDTTVAAIDRAFTRFSEQTNAKR